MLAFRLSSRPPTSRHTYGLGRAEVLGAQANAVLLLAATGWIVFEAVRRLDQPVEVEGAGIIAVAFGGLVVNVWSAVLLARSAGRSLNMRAAFLHLTWDAVGSLAAMATGVVIVLTGLGWVDPVASLAIAVLVLWSVWRLLKDTTHVLMEGTPSYLDAREIEDFLASDSEVEDVHHVHVWNLASEMPALSAHVVISGERSLHEAQIEGDRLRAMVLDRFGIEHTTFELECHGCE
jgi:cobalt-zinc-cadmium efflux system protein